MNAAHPYPHWNTEFIREQVTTVQSFDSADAPPRVTGISIDTRTLQPGEWFVALVGDKMDGHAFLEQAVAKGCSGLLVSRPPDRTWPVPVIQVDDTLTAMTTMAMAWRRRINPRVIAITGSSGKSTIKEMITAGLTAGAVRGYATPGNLNNHIGLPLTMLRMPAACQVLVLEMGMSAAGEIAHLTRVAQPDVGVISNIQPAHLGSFTNLAAIANAKGELPRFLPPHGVAILPGEDLFFPQLKEMARGTVRRFGLHPQMGDQVWADGIVAHKDGMSFTIHRDDGQTVPVALNQTGLHLVLDSLAAAEVAWQLGLASQVIHAGLSATRWLSGRGETRIGRNGCQVVDSTYNANPGSVIAALRALAMRPDPGRRVAILGDMLELGDTAPAIHAHLLPEILAAGVRLLITAGPMMAQLHAVASRENDLVSHHRQDPAEWLGELTSLIEPDDLVLVKGSRGMAMERLVKELLYISLT